MVSGMNIESHQLTITVQQIDHVFTNQTFLSLPIPLTTPSLISVARNRLAAIHISEITDLDPKTISIDIDWSTGSVLSILIGVHDDDT